MATDLRSPDQSVSALVRGIIDDTTELVKQQGALLRAEIRADLRKTKQAAIALSVGAGVCVFAGLSLWLAVVHLLHDLAPQQLPMSACYGIVGGVFALFGGILLYLAVRKLRSFSLLPDESVQALKENLQWLKNPRQSGSR